MEREENKTDEIRRLIEQIDGRLRESKSLRDHADERHRNAPFWPDRRRSPRITGAAPTTERQTSHDE